MKAIIKMLHNTKTGTYHPIWYSEAPLPGPEPAVVRYKSRGHHTAGFPTLEEGIAGRKQLEERLELNGYSPVVEDGELLEWNGEGVPTDTLLRTN